MDATFSLLARHILTDSLKHSLIMIPLLFVTFVLVETVYSKTSRSWAQSWMAHPILGSLVAAVFGLVPQCGFSVAATTLHLEGVIPVGTLIASYIATSDEAIPIMAANASTHEFIVPLLATKLVWGALVGAAINLALRKKAKTAKYPSCINRPSAFEDTASDWKHVAKHGLAKAFRISAMVFVFSSFLNFGGHFLADAMGPILGRGTAPLLLASFFGLIPACATSVALTEGFRLGHVSFPALVSGLTANAGLGLLVLIKETKRPSRAISIVVTLLVSAFIAGVLSSLLVV